MLAGRVHAVLLWEGQQSPSGHMTAERCDLWPPASPYLGGLAPEAQEVHNKAGLRLKSGKGEAAASGDERGGFQGPFMSGGVAGRARTLREPWWPREIFPSPRSCMN